MRGRNHARFTIGYQSAKSQIVACPARPGGVNLTFDNRTAGAIARARGRCYGVPMTSFLSTIVLPILLGAVALVLLLGLINMMRGGSPYTSQKLMRLRV